MGGLVGKLAVKLLKGRWGSILPAVLRAVAEGKFGEPAKKAYWFGAGYRTVTGAALLGLGAALGTVCAGYPDYAWACTAQTWIMGAGAVLASVGLVDGGVRSPWPEGTPKEPQ